VIISRERICIEPGRQGYGFVQTQDVDICDEGGRTIIIGVGDVVGTFVGMVVNTVVGTSEGPGEGVTGVVPVVNIHPAARTSAIKATTMKRVFDDRERIVHCYSSGSYSF
jgi:hypothetical protein